MFSWFIVLASNANWRRRWHPTPVLFPGKSHGWRSLVGCSPWWGHGESDTTERLHFHFSLSCIGEGNGNPLQCSCLENPRDGGAWWAAIYRVSQSWTRLSDLAAAAAAVTPIQCWTEVVLVNILFSYSCLFQRESFEHFPLNDVVFCKDTLSASGIYCLFLFYHKCRLSFVKLLSMFIEIILWLFWCSFIFVNVYYYCLFSNIKPILHFWNEASFIMLSSLLIYAGILFTFFFTYDFCSFNHQCDWIYSSWKFLIAWRLF